MKCSCFTNNEYDVEIQRQKISFTYMSCPCTGGLTYGILSYDANSFHPLVQSSVLDVLCSIPSPVF